MTVGLGPINGRAVASDASDADALIARGLKLRQTFNDRQALPLFQEALEKKKTPRAIAQLGLCELALGLWVEADDHLKQALASATDPWIHKNERSLQTAFDGIQEKLGFLDVWGEPAGARVAVDGRTAGALPMEKPLRLPAGRHSLLTEANGFLADNRFVEIAARTVAREHVALAPVPVVAQTQPPPALGARPPPSMETPGAAVGTVATEPTQDDTASSDPIYKRWWFWTAIGVAVVAAGGTALILSRRDHCEAAGGSTCVAW